MIRGSCGQGLRWYIEDRPYISVTSVIGCLIPPKRTNWFKKTAPEDIKKISSEAAVKGSDAHQSIENVLKGGVVIDNKHDFLKSWLEEQKIKPLHVEPMLVHKKYLYAGQADLICETDKGLWLMDWKTGRGSTQHGHQLAAYVLAFENQFKEKISGMSTVYIDLKKQSAKEFPFTYMDYCKEAWLHTFQAWKAMMFRELMKPITVNDVEYTPMTLEEVKFDAYEDWRQNG